MKIHQFLTSYSYGDAIGNEALAIRNHLRQAGHESNIYALYYHPRYSDQIINYLEYNSYSDPNNIVIFHFSIGSPVTKKFLRLKNKKVIIYHNITPHYFFLDYHRTLAKDCYKGRIELKGLTDKIDLALGDSEYNERELKELGFKNTGVLPLVMDFSKFDKFHSPLLTEMVNDGKSNIIFVGRIIPNKKVEDVIKVFYFYQKYFNANSRLLLVGEYRGFERYHTALQNLVAKLELKDVRFTGHIPEDELNSYFKSAHLYLHMSEHEGFCAPVPESFYLKIPVIAFNAGAVKETMRQGGVLLNKKNLLDTAALMDIILLDDELKKNILASQHHSLQYYLEGKTGAKLLNYLERL